jgi:hypothetical protein
MSYKLLSYQAGRDARAGVLVGDTVYDSAKVTAVPAAKSVCTCAGGAAPTGGMARRPACFVSQTKMLFAIPSRAGSARRPARPRAGAAVFVARVVIAALHAAVCKNRTVGCRIGFARFHVATDAVGIRDGALGGFEDGRRTVVHVHHIDATHAGTTAQNQQQHRCKQNTVHRGLLIEEVRCA